MKNTFVLAIICVIFISLLNVAPTYCFDEQLNFMFNNKIFTYNLSSNIKTSEQFDFQYEINKYNRFTGCENRKDLLQKMLDAGIEDKIALNYLFPNLNKTIEKIKKNIEVKPQNASMKINSSFNRVFNISPEVLGVKVDELLLYNNICKAYLSNKKLLFNIPTIELKPNITKQYFQAFTCLRADFSTDISSSSSDRKHNVKNALTSLNKIEILPGQVFSFNKTVGRRTEANGYRPAKIIVNNEYVEGVGGGVCQVSSTLYNSALLAGLEILEANKHSKQIHYVKYGFDAMVNFGSSDLKIKNNTNQKIIIITNYSSTKARIRIFGESLNGVSYKLKNEIFNVVEPIEETKFDVNGEHLDKVLYEDEFFYFKTGSKGMEIKSFREKYVNGELVNTEHLRHDKFKVQNAIKMFGIKKRTENICAQNYSFSLIGWSMLWYCLKFAVL